MRTRRPERTALAKLFIAGCVTVFGAWSAIETTQAQFVNPVPPPPPPTFNPPSPYRTVPQAPYKSISPRMPSTPSGSSISSRSYETQTNVTPHLHRRTVHSTTGNSHVASASRSHRGYRRYQRSPEVGTSYFPASIAYIPFPYFCTWQEDWDGYWAHRCF